MGADGSALDGVASAVPGLVWAYRFRPDGTAESLPIDKPIDFASGEGWIWLHFDLIDQRSRQWLSAAPYLVPVARNLLLSDDAHLQLHIQENCMSGVLTDFVHQMAAGETSDQICNLRFALTEGLAVSGRRQPLRATEALRQALHDGKTLSAPAALLESLVEHMASEIETAKNGLAEGMDKVEDSVLADELRDERTTLGHLRRRTARLHRRLTALHTLFQRIDPRSAAALSSPLHIAADRIAQRLSALDHAIHDLQERGRQLQDEITAKLATVTNRHLHALSILTAVLLPPTLVTGIFGMNAKDLPLTDVENGYLWALGLCVVSAALVYLLLRKAPGLLKRGGIVD